MHASSYNFKPETLNLMKSLPTSALRSMLSDMPLSKARAMMEALKGETLTDRDKDIIQKRETRSRAAEITIPAVADPARRAACLSDPERFLRTYGEAVFYNPFVNHQRAMIEAIYERAKTGGDKAVAAPRGDGKTQIATWMVAYIILAELRRFPVVLASNGRAAKKIFQQIQRTFVDNPLLVADFPEVCVPAVELDGAPQRAGKQHVGGERTRITWTSTEIGFPFVPGSPYGGCYVTSFGLDCAIRGVHVNGVRPDFALIDDPETNEVATSDEQHYRIEELIDGDVALLAGPDRKIARVILTTIQNRRCYSFRVTDRKLKPSWEGERYRALVKWPERADLWDEYIARRQQAQAGGDKDGRDATEFYRQNLKAMQAGAEIGNPCRFVRDFNADGEPIEVDALQAFYNKVADLGMARVLAELQNDPEEDRVAVETEIAPGIVQRATSRLARHATPPDKRCRYFVGCDVGKYASHWVKIAMWGNAVGHVIDYGVADGVGGINDTSDKLAVERGVLRMLLEWRDDIMADNPPELAMVDSGAFTDGVYEFVRQVGGSPFIAAKGHATHTMRWNTESKPNAIAYDHCRADLQPSGVGLWLYNFDAVYWKRQVHQRFILGPYGADGDWNDGGLSVWASESKMEHKTYSHHVCAEVWEERFIEGKGVVGKWIVKQRKNHWLDATAMALCAAAVAGFRVLPRPEVAVPSLRPQSSGRRLTTSDGRPFLVTERR